MNQAQPLESLAFYVATDGSDAWSGTLAAPNAQKTDGPFATLARARDAVRALKSSPESKGPVTVLVRGGKYLLEETLLLGAADSGTRKAPITYQAYPGEKPILSGGRRVSGWKPYKGEIMQCVLPGAKGGKWKFRRLFCDGRPQIRARHPKFDPDNPLYGGWAFMEGPAEEGSISAFRYKPGTFQHHWSKPSEAEINVFPGPHGYGWLNDIVPVKALDEEKCVITLARTIKDFDVHPWFIPNPFRAGNRFFVENVLEELTQPGEWCLDSEEGLLYFWPAPPVEEAEVVAPKLDCLIDLRGASWITVSGFTFTETTDGDNFLRELGEGYGAMYPVVGWRYCGDAVHLRDAEYCCVVDNHFDAVGGNGVYLESYNLRNVIRHNEFSHAGACGVVLLGNKRRYAKERLNPERRTHWSRDTQPMPLFNRIEDNHIHHCGSFNKYVAGVFLGVSDGNVIGHNLIEHMPHHAVNLGCNRYGRNVVEYNLIRSVSEETGDNGAINSWMDDELDIEMVGHIIRYNYITDVYGRRFDEQGNFLEGDHAFGIYLDNFTSNCFVYGNIIVRCSDSGITLHCGKNTVIENNIIVDCGRSQLRYQYYYDPMPGFLTGIRFCRNILHYTKPEAHLYYLHGFTDRTVAESDHNLFFKTNGGAHTLFEDAGREGGKKVRTLAEWQEMGYDTHSLVADPLFADPEHDDYRLRPGSPALRLGFVPFDVTRIGIRNGEG